MLAPAQSYWTLIRSAKTWLAATLCLFSFGFAVGLVLGLTKPGLIDLVLEHLPGGSETGFPAFILILKHNLMVMAVTWCASLVLAIAPLGMILANGFLVGGLLGFGEISYGVLALLPHGSIELPAILLSNTFFSRLGLRWAFQKNGTDRKRTFVTDFKDSFKIATFCALLFLVAAMIESFATPKILAAYEKEHLGGIGVQLGMQERRLTITHVFPGGPASRAGLSSGLVIQKIDGTETTGKDSDQCGDRIHGRVGTKVRLEVIDMAHSQTNTMDLVRELKP